MSVNRDIGTSVPETLDKGGWGHMKFLSRGTFELGEGVRRMWHYGRRTPCTVPVSNIDDVESDQNMTVLKNGFDKFQKCSLPRIIYFHKVSKLKSPEEHLYMSWRNKNQLKQGS